MKKQIPLKWRSTCGRYTVLISPSCIEKLIHVSKQEYPNEIGTSLIGRYSEDGFDAIILDITPITSDSKRSGYSLIRGIKGLQLFFSSLRKSSGGQNYYVGEWHSHPDGSPVPSNIDDSTQHEIATDKRVHCPESILVIVGGNLHTAPKIGVFVYSRKNRRIDLNPIMDPHG